MNVGSRVERIRQVSKHIHSSAQPPVPHDPQQLLQMGLQLGNFIAASIFDRPLNEQDVPEPWPCSKTLNVTPKGDR